MNLTGTSGASQVALVVKNLPVNVGDIRDVGSIPGSGRSPGGGHGNSLQYSCLENPMDRGAWRAIVHGVARSQTQLKQLSMHPWCKRSLLERSLTTDIKIFNMCRNETFGYDSMKRQANIFSPNTREKKQKRRKLSKSNHFKALDGRSTECK